MGLYGIVVAALTGNARFGLQGRPLFNFAPASLPAGTDMLVRAKSPIYDFALADGAAVAARREITDSAKCLGCHKGSLYQHGGNRIDNVELCVMCHNEASSEQDVRESLEGNLCRCTGYHNIVKSIVAGSKAMAGAK